MNKSDFLKSMSMIDQDIIHEADSYDSKEADEYADSVSDTELYHRPMWNKLAALAASLLLIAGAGAAGTFYFRHHEANIQQDERITPASTVETTGWEKESNSVTSAIKESGKKEKTSAAVGKEETSTQEQNVSTVVTVTAEASSLQISADNTEQSHQTTGRNTAKQTALTVIQTTAIETAQNTAEKPTKQVVNDPDGFANFDIFESLAGLDYRPYTCDGLPEFSINAPDGTKYLLNLSSGWVWRKTPYSPPDEEYKEAWLTKTQVAFLYRHGQDEGIGMTATQYLVSDYE